MVILMSIAAFLSTLIGGFVAIRFKDKLHLIIGFSAGAVLGLVFFDLIPESLELGSNFYNIDMIVFFIAIGFIAYLILDRVITMHSHSHDGCHENDIHTMIQDENNRRGVLRAGSFSIHSLLDGVIIGLTFQVSISVGIIVAIAVLVHDFSDGINVVGLIFRHEGQDKQAYKWLIVNALAPILGASSTLLFTLPEQGLSIVLALFSGFFLYIGASDLIPESHHAHPKFLTTVMTLVGVVVLYIAISLASFH